MNRLSILLGWALLTLVAIGVSSAAVGSVGDRVAPQPASVLEAAGEIVALGPDTTRPSDTAQDPSSAAPTSRSIDPDDLPPAPPTTVGSGPTTTAAPGSGATTTTQPEGGTTTTIDPETTPTTVIDGATTTTTVLDEPTTTTAPSRRTIESQGGWIRIAWTDDWLRLGAAGPRTGFKLEVVANDGDKIIVRFTSRRHISRIVVELDDGRAKVEISEVKKTDG